MNQTESIEARQIPGVNAKVIITLIISTASIVSAYFWKSGEINNNIGNVDAKVEKVDQKITNKMFADSMRFQIMQLQIDQVREDIKANRVFLKDIRDTQLTK